MAATMTTPTGQIRISSGTATVSVTITGEVYSNAAGSSSASFPATISSATTYYVPPGYYTVTVSLNGNVIHSQARHVDNAELWDVTPDIDTFPERASASGTSVTEVIARTVVGAGGAASVDFQSIPATYESLRIVFEARGDAASTFLQLRGRFNNDSGSNYLSQRAGSSAEVDGSAVGSLRCGEVVGANAPAGATGSGVIEIPSYARTAFQKRSVATSGSRYAATTMTADVENGNWLSTAAINRVTLFPASGNFAQDTVFTLYGVKGA